MGQAGYGPSSSAQLGYREAGYPGGYGPGPLGPAQAAPASAWGYQPPGPALTAGYGTAGPPGANWPAPTTANGPGFGPLNVAASVTPGRGTVPPPPPPSMGGPSASVGAPPLGTAPPPPPPDAGPFGSPNPFAAPRPTMGNVGGGASLLPPPPALPQAPVAPPSEPNRRPLAFIAAGLVTAVIAGASLFAVSRRPSAPSHPAVWDARVAELVSFVETERGLTFKHPVYVDFLSKEDLAAKVGVDRAAITPEQRAAADTQARVLRALGLARGSLDLLEQADTLATEGVVAFYDTETDRITAPEGDLSPYQRATLVHELTHALQDQYFNVNRTMPDDGAQAAWSALVEGDATRVADAYTAALSPADLDKYYSEAQAGYSEYVGDTSSVASALGALQQAPYVLGAPMTKLMIDIDGPKAVNNAFRSPAVSEEAFLDPINYRGAGKVKPVDAPRTVAGENVVQDGRLGPLAWYLMLVEATDLPTALNASFGWGGDAYVAVDSGKDLCVRIAFQGDTPEDNTEMAAALTRWAAAAPEARREVAVRGAEVTVNACDPGPDSPIPLAGTAAEALFGPRVVMEVASLAHSKGRSFTEGRCVGMTFVSSLSVDQLQAVLHAPATDQAAQADIAARVAAAVQVCRSK